MGFGGRWVGLGGREGRGQTPSTGLRHPSFKEEGAGKRCSECGSEEGGSWKRKENRAYLGDVGPHDVRPEPLSSEPVKPSARVRVAAEVGSCADGCDQALRRPVPSDVDDRQEAIREDTQPHAGGVRVDVEMLHQGDDELQLLLEVYDPDRRGTVQEEVDVCRVVFAPWVETVKAVVILRCPL